MQVFILGMHRSGTSALARVLNLMGLYFGGENAGTGRSSENEKGFWERRDVRMTNDSILFTSNCDWDLLSGFDVPSIPADTYAGHRSAIANIVMKLDTHRPWFVKEPRLCVTFPLWRETLEQPVCIHIVRNPLEVAHSLKTRNRIPIRVGLALWELYNTRALQAASGLPLLCVSYEDLLDTPGPTVDSVRSFLAGQGDYRIRMPSSGELSSFLDVGLRHHRKSATALSSVATGHQLELYRLLRSVEAPDSKPDDVSRKCLDTLRKYEAAADVGERRRLAKARQKRRRRSHLELHIALQDVELRHALDASRRLDSTRQGLEQRVARLQDARRKLEVQLSASNERARTLRIDNSALRQKTAAHEQLVLRHDDLKQGLSHRQKRIDELELKCNRLQRELHRLKLEQAESEAEGRSSRKELLAVRRNSAELHVRKMRAERELHHFRRQVEARETAQVAVGETAQVAAGETAQVAARETVEAPVEGKGKGGPPVSPGTANSVDRVSKAVSVPTKPEVASVALAPLLPSIGASGVEVVVCVHNALEYVQRCLQSVLTRTSVKFRVVVVNDGSGPATTEWLQGLAARDELVDVVETNDGPLGYTRAANVGLRATRSNYVVLLNSDTIVPRLWLEGMLECMASDDKIGIVGPLSNAATWQSVPERTDRKGGWAVNELPGGYNVDEFAELVFGVSERQFPKVPFLNGFCLMISRAVIDQVGYLDEESFPRGYGEENDYCIRASDAGFRLAIADHCFVYHAKSKSFGTATRDKLAKAGGIALREKHGEKRIEQGTRKLKNSRKLSRIRKAVGSALTPSS
ncbi:MAG: glycosyltransferase [Candidatus Tectomicrobia bacterium]|nr:glycosyltransferase [Candidatus Tectomicrobia bacterium]